MGLFKKTDTPAPSKLARRIQALPTSELIPWAETCLYDAGRCLSEYRKSGEAFWLTDAEQATDTLHLLVSEIKGRAAAASYAPSGPSGLR